nr:Cap [Lactuca sativa CRESS virus]
MVYKRKTFRRKTLRRKAPWYRRRYNALQLAQKAAKGVWYLKGLVNSEVFKRDTPIPNTTINDSTGYVLNCQPVPIGDSTGQRTGNSILVRKLLVRTRITKASSPTSTYIRYFILQDQQQISDTNPAFTDLLETPGDIDSPLSNTFAGRFKILCSKTILLTNDRPSFHMERVFNMRHHIRFNGASGTDVQKGGLYLMMFADQAAAANYPLLDGHVRLSYHDN